MSGGQDVAGRAAAVGLLEPVFQHDRSAGELREVDDDVGALGHAEPDARHLNRSGQQVAVVRDLPERYGCVRGIGIRQKEFVETGRAAVDNAEPVPPRMHL